MAQVKTMKLFAGQSWQWWKWLSGASTTSKTRLFRRKTV